jgi:hypothetical protein
VDCIAQARMESVVRIAARGLLAFAAAACAAGERPAGEGPADKAAACAEGAVDVGAMSLPQGLTFLDLGARALTTSRALLDGKEGRESDMLELCMPDDLVSFVLVADFDAFGSDEAGGLVTSVVTVAEGELLDPETRASYDASSLRPDLADGEFPYASVRYPNAATHVPSGGTYRVRVGAFGENVTPTLMLGVRRGSAMGPQRLTFDVIFADGGALALDEQTSVRAALADLRPIFAPAELDVALSAVGRIDGAGHGDLALDQESLTNLVLANAAVEEGGGALGAAVTVYLVRNIVEPGEPDGGGGTQGYSLGRPGLMGMDREGVVVSVESHREDGVVDVPALATTVAHELGHLRERAHPHPSPVPSGRRHAD